MEYWGDGRCRGYARNHWNKLSMYLIPSHATGNLKEESVYAKEDKQGDDDLYTGVEGNLTGASVYGTSGKPLVLKVLLCDPKMPKNEGKNLSRVG